MDPWFSSTGDASMEWHQSRRLLQSRQGCLCFTSSRTARAIDTHNQFHHRGFLQKMTSRHAHKAGGCCLHAKQTGRSRQNREITLDLERGKTSGTLNIVPCKPCQRQQQRHGYERHASGSSLVSSQCTSSCRQQFLLGARRCQR